MSVSDYTGENKSFDRTNICQMRTSASRIRLIIWVSDDFYLQRMAPLQCWSKYMVYRGWVLDTSCFIHAIALMIAYNYIDSSKRCLDVDVVTQDKKKISVIVFFVTVWDEVVLVIFPAWDAFYLAVCWMFKYYRMGYLLFVGIESTSPYGRVTFHRNIGVVSIWDGLVDAHRSRWREKREHPLFQRGQPLPALPCSPLLLGRTHPILSELLTTGKEVGLWVVDHRVGLENRKVVGVVLVLLFCKSSLEEEAWFPRLASTRSGQVDLTHLQKANPAWEPEVVAGAFSAQAHSMSQKLSVTRAAKTK
ncbi:LOW QUALITY PROTEIN: hypothetical protein CKAN_02729600 [Cinnamomum micranthum f. kanehirae]|uniref:Uncharacterized protein n=1 Tax=Cinnamomum micranthum f. kanehirae TaxID=337451 RepID=A0A443Q477_9MAGN|nr:LOW QUALITY PROTEIN: hypothetical protein CKAN_02729600 [Cinnamomum micranthum f. kanehirae]